MAGSAQQGMTTLKLAVEALMKALPSLPMGSDLQSAALKAVTELSKHMGENAGGGAADQMQQLVQMARAARTNPSPLMGMMPGGPPGAGAPPGGAPPGGAPPPPIGA